MVRALTMLAVLLIPAAVPAQGKLDAVRDEVDRPRSSNDSDRASTDDSGPCPTDDGSAASGEGDGFQGLFLATVLSPWTAPHAILDPGLKVDGRFTRYPYAASDTGHILLDREVPGKDPGWFHDRTDTSWYAVRASAEVGDDFDGLTRVGLRLFLDTDTRFGLKSDWDYYRERLSCGCRDELWLGDLTATFRFAQGEWVQMHTGVGARFLMDHGNDRAGINFLYGLDAFPVEPLHLFGSAEVGTLGSASLWRLRGGVGVNWSHAELFAGYDCVRIGSVYLQGPFLGLRLWF
jgi:hypothetical protein